MCVIEGGNMVAMRRDPRFLRFQSWADVPPDDLPDGIRSILLFLHCDCFESSCGELEEELVVPDDRDSRHCDLCRRGLDDGHKVFQVTEWCPERDAELENGQPEFILDASCEKIILCPSCLKKILGEGDEEEGDALLLEGVLSG
jgi:hypothetical protein